MMSLKKPLGRLVAAACLVILPATASLAQIGAEPRIAIPTPVPGPGNPPPQQPFDYAGCYAINQDLYGPYRMTFCLSRYGGGSYHVSGGGLNCNGWIDWHERNGEARVNVRESWCGRGVNWSADTMICRPMQQQPWQQPPGQWQQPGARIAVPTPAPTSNDLRCAYYPGVRGYDPVSVIAEKGWY